MSGSEAEDILRDLVAGRPVREAGAGALASLRERAAHHGLSELVRHRAEGAGLTLSDELRRGILDDAESAARLRAVLDLELRRVLGAVRRPERPPIIVKGPAVAVRYREPKLRVYTDVDLLVAGEDVDPWRSALEGLGYRGPAPARARDARRYGHELKMSRPGPTRPILVELHWRLFSDRRARHVGYEALAGHSAPAGFADGALCLEPAALLVALALHLAHHSGEAVKLKWLLDLIELGREATVLEARDLALGLGVGWALEQALADAEAVLEEPRWGATPEVPAGLAAARRETARGLRHHLATARDLGPLRGTGYLIGRLNPSVRTRRNKA
jgi:putative nucleotidyltransferase-like protein